jgi:hypothetical protein
MICFAPAVADNDGFWISGEGLDLAESVFRALAAVLGVRVVAAVGSEALARRIRPHTDHCALLPESAGRDREVMLREAWKAALPAIGDAELVFLVDPRNPAAGNVLAKAVERLRSGEARPPLAAVSNYTDHPCQYFREHAVVDMSLVILSPLGGATVLNQHGSRPMPSTAGGAGLVLSLPDVRGDLTVSCIPFDKERLYSEHAFQQDAAPSAVTVDLPLRPGWCGLVVLVSSTTSCNGPTLREWLEGPLLPWTVPPVKGTHYCAVFDGNGTKVSGRQLFPDIKRHSGHLLAAAPEDVTSYLEGGALDVLARCEPLPLPPELAHLVGSAFEYLEYQVAMEEMTHAS